MYMTFHAAVHQARWLRWCYEATVLADLSSELLT